MNIKSPEQILEYWFGSSREEWDRKSEAPNDAMDDLHVALWWGKRPGGRLPLDAAVVEGMDKEIATLFSETIHAGEEGFLTQGDTPWTEAKEPEGALALLILNGYMHKRIFRNHRQKVLENDEIAVKLASTIVAIGADTDKEYDYTVYERKFIYLALANSGDKEEADLGLAKLKELLEEIGIEGITNSVACLKTHIKNLELAWGRFGTNPYRKALKEEACTAEENEFINENPWL
eukprot:CAMPEP_0197517972 /NCGR_PEP_ID=MMETSP1318-20131121/3063_1 /TAXON_ID=552666 /ORGANISM="Partenskyella glossopodia, Strain RCC365" /LENGTH=233 /DNA_ID=CAMNT_0043067951 /DNA_START=148 /DNA_END=849 /DNA_ORIENTATION=+